MKGANCHFECVFFSPFFDHHIYTSHFIVGKELSYLLSEMGAKVILSARSEDKLATIKDSLAAPENAR